jgi:AmmeMemoRadiSam system protein A
MAGALDGLAVRSELLSYEGPFGVGYAVAAFEPQGPDEGRHFGAAYEKRQLDEAGRRKAGEDAYVRLARASLEYWLEKGSYLPLPEGLPADLTERKAGVFVSLKKEGRFRGCIGTTGPTTGSVAEEIIRNAVSAGVRDPRFDPVEVVELGFLTYSVDVLGEAELISSIEQLDPFRYGVIVYCGGRQGLLLPNLEGVDTPERQVEIALQKAGIGPEEPYSMSRFEVVRHKAP